MPAPLAHTCGGFLLYRDVRAYLFENPVYAGSYVIFFSNAPDYDYFLGLFKGNLLLGHRLFTHSIFFAVVAGLLACIIGRISPKRFPAVFLITCSLILVHLLLDYLSFDPEPSNGIGIPLFWPFSDLCYNFPFHPGARYLSSMSSSLPLYLIVNELYYVALCSGLIILRTRFERQRGPDHAHRSNQRYPRRA